jgi:hypothetical protein
MANTAAELERLRLQARVWEPEAEALLDRIGVTAGWSCADLGCGPVGILGPLSHRVGEMQRLVRPGGVLAIQEPDSTAWAPTPRHPAWDRLTKVIGGAFARRGGDFDVGRRTYGMLRHAGLQDVDVRVAVLSLPDGHPYRRLPIQFAASLRHCILEDLVSDETELEELIADCEKIAADPETYITTFILTQAWGRVPTL